LPKRGISAVSGDAALPRNAHACRKITARPAFRDRTGKRDAATPVQSQSVCDALRADNWGSSDRRTRRSLSALTPRAS